MKLEDDPWPIGVWLWCVDVSKASSEEKTNVLGRGICELSETMTVISDVTISDKCHQ